MKTFSKILFAAMAMCLIFSCNDPNKPYVCRCSYEHRDIGEEEDRLHEIQLDVHQMYNGLYYDDCIELQELYFPGIGVTEENKYYNPECTHVH